MIKRERHYRQKDRQMDNDKERVRLAEEIGSAKKSREAINIKYQFLLLLLPNLFFFFASTKSQLVNNWTGF